MVLWCEQCGREFTHARPGRTPRFCTARCRKAASRARPRLPRELTDASRWAARDGKRPVRVDGRPASSTVADTWTTYENVKHLPHGIMLGGGLGCWDLDHCLNAGVLASWAREVVDRIPSESIVWVERSMSGDGVHVFVRSPERPGRRRAGVEFYSRARFIAVTGDRFVL